MKTGKAITFFSILILMTLFLGQAQGAEGHNYDPNVTTPLGTTVVDCDWCHKQTHTDQPALAGFVPTKSVVYERCFQCHNASDVSAPASNKGIIGNHTSDGSIDCGKCHEVHDISGGKIASTDNHSNTTPLAGQPQNNIKYIRKDMTKYVPGASANTVFQQSPEHWAFASSDPDSVTGEYNGICQTCHDVPTEHHRRAYTDDHQITKSTPSDDTTWKATNCLDCHQHTYTPSNIGEKDAFKPWHQDTNFGWDAAGECKLCHGDGTGTDAIVSVIHRNNCDLCHNAGAPKNKTTLKVGDSFTDPADSFSPAGSASWAGVDITATCTDCHTNGSNGVTGFHGLTIAEVKGRHQLSSDTSGGYDCEACHSSDAANAQLNTHMGTDSVANCVAVCHDNATGPERTGAGDTSITPKKAIKAVTFDWPYVNKNDSKCEDCHQAKGYYKLHGLTDDDSPADGINNATFPGSATPAVNHNNLSSAAGQSVSYTGKLATYGGIKVTTYSCDDCHSGDRVNATSLEAMQAHTAQNGTGTGNCLTCHNGITDFENVIASGTAGGGNTPVNCENCHNATINGGGVTNSPSGKRMYQYDGIRHHTTQHAQAGDCTWCHADPRPAVPTTANGFGATATAASSNNGVGAYDTGWDVDFTGVACPTPPPKQIGCRLCHTNYETYSVDVKATNNNDTDSTDTNDLHGYHINSSKTTGYSDSGLVVYANNFNAETVTSYPSGSRNPLVYAPNNRVTQASLASHRIVPNSGTAKIAVYDYGACLGCHSINLFHAAPIAPSDYPTPTSTETTLPYDTLRYAPGRSVFNILPDKNFDGAISSDDCGSSGPSGGNNTEDWDQHCEPEKWNGEAWNNKRGEDLMRRTYNKNPSYNEMFHTNGAIYSGFTRTAVPGYSAFSNYEVLNGIPTNGSQYSGHDTGSGGGVVTFADITAPTLPGTVNIVTGDSVVNEGDVKTITARRSGGSDGAVSATVTVSGTAQAADYTLSSTTFNWAAGDTTDQAITLTIADDGATENAETVILTITSTTGNMVIGANPDVTTTIAASDQSAAGTVNITTPDASWPEDVGTVTITASRTGGSTGAVTAAVTMTGTATPGVGNDYTLSSNAFFWADGDSADKTIIITVNDDTIVEPSETIIMTVSSTTGGLLLGSDDSVTTTITNNDINVNGIFEYAQADYTVAENGGSIDLAVNRTGGSTGAVTVDYSDTGTGTAPGADYTVGGTGALSWADGDTSPKTITVTVNDNGNVDGSRTVILDISNPTGGAVLGSQTTTTLTITDDEAPPNQPPYFQNPPYTGPDATVGTAYSTTVAQDAVDPEGDPITYSNAGTGTCTWTSVAADGTISGTPATPAGTCTVDVTATATGGSDTATVSINVLNSVPIDHGRIPLVDGAWQNVTFNRIFATAPVVVISKEEATQNAQHPNLRNVSTTGFEVRMFSTGGTVTPRPVHWIAIEPGAYTAATHGVKMDVIAYSEPQTNNSGDWSEANPRAISGYTDPIVVGSVQTNVDDDWSAFWVSDSSSQATAVSGATTQLRIGKHVAEDPTTARSTETVGYIIIEAGTGTMLGGTVYEAGSITGVQGWDNTPPYNATLTAISSVGAAVAANQHMAGANGAYAVVNGTPTPTTLPLVMEEDTLSDTEQAHAATEVGYLVIEGPNQPPAFQNPPYTGPDATVGTAYSTTVAQDAVDPEGDPITYSRNGGTCSTWASVAGDGTISGTPAASDVGTCTVIVRATATGGFDEATVTITVNTAPTAVTLDATSGMFDNGGTATSFSWSHTVGAGANYLVVGIGMDSRNGDSVSSVSYTGATCSQLGESDAPGNNSRGRSELWGCTSPTAGTANITVIVTGNPGKTFVLSASSWNSVGSATNVVTANSTTTDLSLSISTVSSSTMVVDHFASYKGNSATQGGSQTAIYIDTTDAGGSVVGGGSYASGTGGNVTMSWADGGNAGYNGLVAVELAP